MSYEPHTWVAGETVTPSKLNHIEQGLANGGGGVLFVTDNNGTLSYTWQEVADAIENNQMVFLKIELSGTIYFCPLTAIQSYGLRFNFDYSEVYYAANSANEYPIMEDNPK